MMKKGSLVKKWHLNFETDKMKTSILPASAFELKDKSFYWVKPFPNSVWEIGRYRAEGDCFKFTDGGRVSDKVHEIGKEIIHE